MHIIQIKKIILISFEKFNYYLEVKEILQTFMIVTCSDTDLISPVSGILSVSVITVLIFYSSKICSILHGGTAVNIILK